MWTRSKKIALTIIVLAVSSIALAHSDGIYNPAANSIGNFEGIDSNAASGVTPPTANFRVTSTGDSRVTSAGDTRVITP